MTVHVVATEYGRPASNALAQVLAQAKGDSLLAPVTVIVPSNFAGLAARRMLGSGLVGVDGVANVSFVTPFRLAELLAVGQLRGRKPLTKPVLGAAVRRALHENPRHFRAIRDHQATERALADAVGELSNVSGRSLAAIEDTSAHAAGIVGLYRDIKGHLTGFHDEADVARAATERNDLATAAAPFGHMIWYLPAPLSMPLQKFLQAVFGCNPTVVIAATSGDQEVDHEIDVLVSSVCGAAFPALSGPASAPPLASHVISTSDADEEVRAVIREVLQLVAEGVPLDRIGIFHPTPDPYVRILQQQFAAANVSANGPSRRRLSESIAGRVLVGALALPAEQWRRDRVIALVSSGPLRHDGKPARPGVWDMLSRQAGVVGGLVDWRAKLAGESAHQLNVHERAMEHALNDRAQSAQARYDDRAQSAQARYDDVTDLAAFIESVAEMLDAVANASGWTGRSQAALELLQSLLGRAHMHAWWPEAEQAAFEAVELALERLAMLEEIDPEPSMAVFKRALASELSVARGRSGRFGDGVVYGPLATAAGHDLDAVFILGCVEGLCPTPRREDVLLPERARQATRGELAERLKQIDEQHRFFLAALATAPPERRWLFYPRGDLRSSRRSRPSRWLLPTASHLAKRALYATDFEDKTPPGVFELRSHAAALLAATHYTSVEERDVASVHAYVTSGGEAALHPAAEQVERGLAAQSARAGADFTEFDGNIAAALVTTSGGPAMSASKLEMWATCGFRYFLAHELGLSERDDPERTIELSALDRGSALHAVLERFLEEAIAHGVPAPDQPWSPQQRARAQEIAAEVFEEYERRGRTGRPVEWATQKSDLLALLDEFLTADDHFRASAQATPAHYELPFGMGGHDPLVIELDHGRELLFRGKIDRVDFGPTGDAFVSDYKTGKGADYKNLADADDPTNAGQMLQLGLYAEAVAQRLGSNAVDTRYWMVNSEAGHARYGYPWTRVNSERLHTVLATISQGIDRGVFALVPGEWESHRSTYANCKYCEFDGVCPRARAEHATDKADAPELAVRVALQQRPPHDDAADTADTAAGDTGDTGDAALSDPKS